MLKCLEVVEHADAYLADELTKWQRIQFRVHLAVCRHCRRYVRQLKMTQKLSQRQILTMQTTDQQVEDIWAKLQQQGK
jgi:anti-sigma factor RsiW